MKNNFLTAIAVFLIAGTSYAQIDASRKYAETITQADLKKQLSVVASAEMEGRETGTRGQRKAADYIESQFKAMGLQPAASLNGFKQFYPLLKDTLVPKNLKIGKQALQYSEDYILQNTPDGQNNLRANQIVFAGYGIEDENYTDYAGKDVAGKVVLIISGEPRVEGKYLVSGTTRPSRWGFSTTMKANVASEKGAAAVIMVNTSWDTIPGRLAASSKSTNLYFPRDNGQSKVNVITIVPSQLKNIFDEENAAKILAKAKDKDVLNTIEISKKITTKLNFKKSTVEVLASNVLGFIEGTDKKDEYVFLTAHYDHLGKRGDVIYYGADDDGSGTVSVIEIAEAFAKAKEDGHGPRRTVVFMAVSGEEKGLWGSEYYSEHPVFPLEKTTVDLNIDMIGRLDPNRNYGDSTNYIYVVGDDKLSSDLKPISIAVNDKYTQLELDYKFNDPNDPERIYFRSDHYNFARKGVPIIFYFDGIHADYHKPSDTVDKINFDVMEKRARFIFHTAWEVANRDEMLKRDIPLPAEVR